MEFFLSGTDPVTEADARQLSKLPRFRQVLGIKNVVNAFVSRQTTRRWSRARSMGNVGSSRCEPEIGCNALAVGGYPVSGSRSVRFEGE